MTSLTAYNTCLHVQLTGQEEEERIERFLGRLSLAFIGVQVIENNTVPKSLSIFFSNAPTDTRRRLAEGAVSILASDAQYRIEMGSWEPPASAEEVRQVLFCQAVHAVDSKLLLQGNSSNVELVGDRLIRLRFKERYDYGLRDGLYTFFGQMARFLVRILIHGDDVDGFTDSVTTTASPARLYHLQTLLENSAVVEAFAILEAPVYVPPWVRDTSGRWPLAFNPLALQT